MGNATDQVWVKLDDTANYAATRCNGNAGCNVFLTLQHLGKGIFSFEGQYSLICNMPQYANIKYGVRNIIIKIILDRGHENKYINIG